MDFNNDLQSSCLDSSNLIKNNTILKCSFEIVLISISNSVNHKLYIESHNLTIMLDNRK